MYRDIGDRVSLVLITSAQGRVINVGKYSHRQDPGFCHILQYYSNTPVSFLSIVCTSWSTGLY